MNRNTTAILALLMASSAQGGTLTEDFTTYSHADFTATTGLWNTVDHVAQAAVVATTVPVTTADFGNGSDGVLNSSTGYAFDTNAHPNGYNFASVTISAGAITVTGSNPLIIRSLGTVNIAPALNLGGAAVAATVNGQAGQAANVAGANGGTALGALVNGGQGGDGTHVNGRPGTNADGTTDALTPGAGSTLNGTNGSPGSNSLTRPGAINGWPTSFVSGTAGGGGGAFFINGADVATGGGGGAGGGTLRISAVGTLQVGTIDVSGGAGGASVKSAGSANCSGAGAGGNGGAIWLQSFKTITPAGNTILGGAGGGAGVGCAVGTAGSAGLNGRTRLDETVGGNFSTTNAAAGTSYVVQSTGYDLGTSDAVFNSNPTVSSQPNGGSISIVYAGSKDGSSYSGFTSNLLDLSDQGYRYLKFQIQITTNAVAGPSPTVSSISLMYSGPPDTVDGLALSAGCGSLQMIGAGAHLDRKASDRAGETTLLFWSLVYASIWFLARRLRAA